MPGAFGLGHQAIDRAVLVDHVMRADLGLRIGQALQRGFGTRHAGVMQHHHVHRPAAIALVEIGGWGFDEAHDHSPAVLLGAGAASAAASRLVLRASTTLASRRVTISTPTIVTAAPNRTRSLKRSSRKTMPKTMPRIGASVKPGLTMLTGYLRSR